MRRLLRDSFSTVTCPCSLRTICHVKVNSSNHHLSLISSIQFLLVQLHIYAQFLLPSNINVTLIPLCGGHVSGEACYLMMIILMHAVQYRDFKTTCQVNLYLQLPVVMCVYRLLLCYRRKWPRHVCHQFSHRRWLRLPPALWHSVGLCVWHVSEP